MKTRYLKHVLAAIPGASVPAQAEDVLIPTPAPPRSERAHRRRQYGELDQAFMNEMRLYLIFASFRQDNRVGPCFYETGNWITM
jgi:hypothetical protein